MFYDLVSPGAGVRKREPQLPADLHRKAGAKAPDRSTTPRAPRPTFDEPVPLYLAPVTLEARQDDFDRLAPLRAKTDDADHGVYGVELFSSGRGVGLLDERLVRGPDGVDLKFTASDRLDDFTSRMADGKVLRQVLAEVTAHQVNELRNPDLLRSGGQRRPDRGRRPGAHRLRPAPLAKAVLAYTGAEAAYLENALSHAASEMADRDDAWAEQVAATLPDQDGRQAPWVRAAPRRPGDLRAAGPPRGPRLPHGAGPARRPEDRRRARHPRRRRRGRPGAGPHRRRPQDRRGPGEGLPLPAGATIAGDEPGTPGALKNRTVYPYRYLSRTHRLFYWTRPDDESRRPLRRGPRRGAGERRISPPARRRRSAASPRG